MSGIFVTGIMGISTYRFFRKYRLISYISLLLVTLHPLSSLYLEGSPSTSENPNIVLIIADDLGWADVGYNGQNFYETPNIDYLASEGVIFDRFYASAANCAPSRASLLTGTYTPRHHVYVPQGLSRGGPIDKMRFKTPTQGADASFNTFHVSINQVDPSFVSIAELLKAQGYRSGRFGKWHIGDDNQGFDVSTANGEPGFITNVNGTEQRFYTDVNVAQNLTEAAVDFIKESKNTPFFVYLSHWEVHTPLSALEERIQYYSDKKAKNSLWEKLDPTYAAEVEQVDSSVGEILKVLEELSLTENTLVIFTSDNGGVSSVTDNAPLRAGKGTYYEGGIRVPFCLKWGSKAISENRIQAPVSGVDIFPTLAEVSGARLPKSQPQDGDSLFQFVNNDSPPDRDIFFHFPLYLGGNANELVIPAFDGTPNIWRAVPSTVCISGDWKLIWYYEFNSAELYNIAKDPGETRELSRQYPTIFKELKTEIDQWVKETQAPIPHILNTSKAH